MQTSTKKVNALGFDTWQIASIRRAKESNRVSYNRMAKIAEKIEALGAEYKALEEQVDTWEGPVKQITMKVLGLELNSQQVLAYSEKPELFVEAYPEHPQAAIIRAALGTPVAEAPEAPAEEIPVPEEEPVGDVPAGEEADPTDF